MKFVAPMLARIAAWSLALAIVILSYVPAHFRPDTPLPHKLEHFAIFLPTGLVFGCGYGQRPAHLAALLVVFAGLLEVGQRFAEGRHARLSDFVVDATGLCIGVFVAFFSGASTLVQKV